VISVPVDWIAVSHIVERHATDSSLQSIAPPRQKPSHGRINVIASAHPLIGRSERDIFVIAFPWVWAFFSGAHLQLFQCVSCSAAAAVLFVCELERDRSTPKKECPI
jgi:hypothetical protein